MQQDGRLISDIQYVDHAPVHTGRGDPPVYKVRVKMTGPANELLGGHQESIVCEVLVQDCASERPDDLRRCAMREFKKLSQAALECAGILPTVVRGPSKLTEARRVQIEAFYGDTYLVRTDLGPGVEPVGGLRQDAPRLQHAV